MEKQPDLAYSGLDGGDPRKSGREDLWTAVERDQRSRGKHCCPVEARSGLRSGRYGQSVCGKPAGMVRQRILVFLGILFDIAVFLVVMAVGVMLRRLQKGGRALANGDLNAKVDTSNMRGEFREHGENLNNISRGMAIAIEQRDEE